jgi:alkanesulfonate monooxygenase SsuD/methylene tetrahydromethanopterin reductase-like flavin-dependent oxidoreductase (luciferase family)
MTPLKVDVMLSNSVIDAAQRARDLQRTGVDGVFTFENAHDLFFPLIAAAPVCSLDLMTNVAIAFPRSPVHLAHAAYDLQLLSKGRFRLGLGSQIKAHIERRFGARWYKPVPQMREWVLATKAILESWQEGTRIDFRGEYTAHTLMTPAFDPGPNPYGVPKILVGALGPKMNEMAAEVADGILVMPFNSERHMRERTIPAIQRGLAAAGRTLADLEITVEVIVAVVATKANSQRPWACGISLPSTDRRPPTAPCSMLRAGATCSPSSTLFRSEESGSRWPDSSQTKWSRRSPCMVRPNSAHRRSSLAMATGPTGYALTFPTTTQATI